MDRPDSVRGGKNAKTKSILAIGIVICLVILTTAFSLFYLPAFVAMRVARETAKGVRQFLNFQPEVKINNIVVIAESKSIVELALASRDVAVEYDYEHTFFGSTKTLKLRGVYRVKAGFDLSQNTISLNVSRGLLRRSLKLVAALPAPKILSIDQIKYEVLEDTNGYWNKLTGDERQSAVWAMRALASQRAQNLNIKKEVQEKVENVIRDSAAKDRCPVEFNYRSTPQG